MLSLEKRLTIIRLRFIRQMIENAGLQFEVFEFDITDAEKESLVAKLEILNEEISSLESTLSEEEEIAFLEHIFEE